MATKLLLLQLPLLLLVLVLSAVPGQVLAGQSTHADRHRLAIRRPSAVGPDSLRRLYLDHKERGGEAALEQLRRRSSIGPQGSTEESAANPNLTPEEQCTPYSLPEIEAIQSSFPRLWTPATILPGDQEALSAMQAINASGIIPANIPVRGQQPQALSGVGLPGNYSPADPDCWWTASHCMTPKHAGIRADVTACPEPGTWGYTQDDGPNCTHNTLYEKWAQNNQKASLMYIGSNVLNWPLEAQRGVADGHHICVHTWSHRYLTSQTSDEVFAEFWYTLKIIKSVMGITPTCWRPPYGDVDDRVRAIAQALGLTTIMWSLDSEDWDLKPYGTISPEAETQTYSSFFAQATGIGKTQGVIVLEHELEDAAMNFTINMYDPMVAAWSHVMPVASCMNWTQPYVESEYVYPNFAEYVAGNHNMTNIPSGADMSITSASVATATAMATSEAGSLSSSMSSPHSGSDSLTASSGAASMSGSGSSRASATAASQNKASSAQQATRLTEFSCGLLVVVSALVAGSMATLST